MIDDRISRRAADHQARRTAQRVGWARIGLGLAALVAPERVARMTGLAGHDGTVRVVGLRELACGVGLVMSREPRAWMWACVAGDAMDLGVFAAQAHGDPEQAPRAAVSLMAVAGITAADVALARRMSPALDAHEPRFDYRDRSGFPKPPDAMRGAALRPATVEADSNDLPGAASPPTASL